MQRSLLLLGAMPVCAFKLGIENISQEVLAALRVGPVGLVTNQTGVDQSGRRSIDLLMQQGVPLAAIYVPEHGLEGKVSAGADVFDSRDLSSGLPVISLYASGAGKIELHAFDGVNTIALDLQDVGMRHYTYISTLYTVMQACARVKKPLIVFDRPNLLGAVMEGPVCSPQLHSFIGIASIPLRHGMTMGELATLFNTYFLSQKVALTVVPLAHYQRENLSVPLLAHLSPNIKTLASVQGYSFLGLVGEVAPFHVGVGTEDAFRIIALPQELGITAQAWLHLQKSLESFGVRSERFDCWHEKKKKRYDGLRLLIDDINEVKGFKAFMSVLSWVKRQGIPIHFAATFDKSIGTSMVRSRFLSQDMYDDVLDDARQQAQQFFDLHKDVFMYRPYPKLVRADTYYNAWFNQFL